MTRLATLFLSVTLLLLPGASAGPACARKNWQAEDCILKCRSNWGWQGSPIGTDPWGSVMAPSSSDLDSIIAEACGTTISSAPPASQTSQLPTVQNVGPSIPATTTTTTSSSTSTTTTSSSTSTSTTSSSTTTTSTTTSTTHTPEPTVNKAELQPSSPSSTAELSHTSTSVHTSTPTSPPPPPSTSSKQSQSSPPPPPPPPPPSSPQTSTAPQAEPTQQSSNSDISQYLSIHNSFRAQHGAGPMTWNNNLAAKAQQWANGCQFKHSGGSLGPFGENLAAGTGDSYDIAAAIKSWTDESSQYDPNNPVPSHFTQVVWKASNGLGCAMQECDGIFDPSFGKAKYFVCEYSPQGNIIGSFQQNVQP